MAVATATQDVLARLISEGVLRTEQATEVMQAWSADMLNLKALYEPRGMQTYAFGTDPEVFGVELPRPHRVQMAECPLPR